MAEQQIEPQRLLFIFLEASLPDEATGDETDRFQSGEGGALQPVMCVDKTLDELTTFADLVAESEQMEQDWHIVLIACLDGRNGKMPSSEDADRPLQMMVQAVENGDDLSNYLAFDRSGVLVQFG